MVEGHGVHRVAHALRSKLVGRTLNASSPNGRFADGAAAIDNLPFSRVEAIGKNLFAFFGEGAAQGPVVVHVHFGMAGVWAIFDVASGKAAAEPKDTTRLRLEGDGVVSHLSAMTVNHGGAELFDKFRAQLGQDPLRDDADTDALWAKVATSKRSIGQLLMDQSFFAGPGNIYRAEILFVAGVHPELTGVELTRDAFDRIWAVTVRLMRDGFLRGSIITVDAAEARRLGTPTLRRYIYDRATCGRCNGRVVSWQISARTCYACTACQPRAAGAPTPKGATDAKVFNSHCAPEPPSVRLEQGGFGALTVAELRAMLAERGAGAVAARGGKAVLIARLEALHAAVHAAEPPLTSALDAAAEKARAGESRAVEHVAELAPEQVRAALGGTSAQDKRAKRAAPAEAERSGSGSVAAAFRQRKLRAARAAPVLK
ncbi:hypothetical protein KFE25_001937 [Diacronema lutheri]|uniref:DNA-(apurinic or apyrimidinic site) lyase n=1 Tax=Diacronema lutheri TaxID=2081491 RepID=A0A8J5XCH8_DIALT|nr:hypothetical protein KFE25_001937 [Diacronema lutheri]